VLPDILPLPHTEHSLAICYTSFERLNNKYILTEIEALCKKKIKKVKNFFKVGYNIEKYYIMKKNSSMYFAFTFKK